MATCHHEIASEVLDGNTFWFCAKCWCRLEGSLAEFPDLTPGEIMHDFFNALPAVEGMFEWFLLGVIMAMTIPHGGYVSVRMLA